ncbi:Predicted hydrolase or acyltransferase [Candidatus Terasakiella magnetica]|uniref:Predicted hydrolase or acyltransferase n=1 Tax=Candidatus Terasakiella magnetica TaxID=1867952 RepID=A0A1C3RET0_9PROT|nr:alpha/beta hydrolase [Candidatus Terasakiella magnetica]SCA55758.1 Predicted hydrolase or acyltransferase [Candidatus Terasakiella magnetica]
MPPEIIELKATKKNGKKAPILFIHGSFCAAPIWRHRFMPFFADHGHDCYAVNLSGHGPQNDWTLHLCGLSDFVQDVIDAVDHIGEPPVLVGHSLGGMVVQKYIEDHDCAGAILLNSLPPSGALSSIMHIMSGSLDLYWSLNQVMMFGPDAMSFEMLKRLLVSDDTHPASLAEAHGLFQPESLRAINEVAYLDVPRRRAKEGTAIAVIGGDADVMIPVSALKETAEFHEADLEIIPGAPHAVMLDKRWKMVAERIRSWMLRST